MPAAACSQGLGLDHMEGGNIVEEAITETSLEGLRLLARGKVRDLYDLDDKLLIVATDRISAFDCVMPNGIPGKGKILTSMSLFWFDFMGDLVENHLLTPDVDQYPHEAKPHRALLQGRSMLVKKARRIDVECVARGYLSGSGWREYQQTQSVCGISLPSGLRESEKLPEPLFTPATKAASGHDINISFEQAAQRVAPDQAALIRDLTLSIYERARDFAWDRGVIIADTKFEFGTIADRILLIDEVLSPDSSRFWPRATYDVGRPQQSYDKQFVRDYLETLDWDKTPPAPALPDHIVARTLDKYREAHIALVGAEPPV